MLRKIYALYVSNQAFWKQDSELEMSICLLYKKKATVEPWQMEHKWRNGAKYFSAKNRKKWKLFNSVSGGQ